MSHPFGTDKPRRSRSDPDRNSHSHSTSPSRISSVLSSALSGQSPFTCCVPLDHFSSVPLGVPLAELEQYRQFSSMTTPSPPPESPRTSKRWKKQALQGQVSSSDCTPFMKAASTSSTTSSSLSSSLFKKVAPLSSLMKPSRYLNTVGWVETSSSSSSSRRNDRRNKERSPNDDDGSNDSSTTPTTNNISRKKHNNHDTSISPDRAVGQGGRRGGGMLLRDLFFYKRKKKKSGRDLDGSSSDAIFTAPSPTRKKVSFAPTEDYQYYLYETESMSHSSSDNEEEEADDDDQDSMTTNAPADERKKRHGSSEHQGAGSSPSRSSNSGGGDANKNSRQARSSPCSSTVGPSSAPRSSSSVAPKSQYHVDIQRMNRWLLQARYNRQMNRWSKYDWEAIARYGVKTQVVLSPGYPGTGNKNSSVRNQSSRNGMINKMIPKKRRRAGASRLGWQVTLANVTCVLDYTMTTLLDCQLRPSATNMTRSGSVTTSPAATAIYPAVISSSMQEHHEYAVKLLKKDPNMVTTHTILVLLNDGDETLNGGNHMTTLYGILARELIAEDLCKNHRPSSHTSDVVSVIEHMGGQSKSNSEKQGVVFDREPLDWTFYNNLLKRASRRAPTAETTVDSHRQHVSASINRPLESMANGKRGDRDRIDCRTRHQDLIYDSMNSVLSIIYKDLERLGARRRRVANHNGATGAQNADEVDGEADGQWTNVDCAELPAYAVLFVLCSSSTKRSCKNQTGQENVNPVKNADSRCGAGEGTASPLRRWKTHAHSFNEAAAEAASFEENRMGLYVSIQRLAQLLEWRLTLWGIRVDVPVTTAGMSASEPSKSSELGSTIKSTMSEAIFSSYCAASLGPSSPESTTTPATATTKSMSSSSVHSTTSSISSMSSAPPRSSSNHWKMLQSVVTAAKMCQARVVIGTGECNVNYISGIASKFSVTLSSLRERVLSSSHDNGSNENDNDGHQPLVISTRPYQYNNQAHYQSVEDYELRSQDNEEEGVEPCSDSPNQTASFSCTDDEGLSEWKRVSFNHASAVGLEIQMEPINGKGLYLVYEVDVLGQVLGKPMATKSMLSVTSAQAINHGPLVNRRQGIDGFYIHRGRIHSMACHLADLFNKLVVSKVSMGDPSGTNEMPPKLVFASYKLHRCARYGENNSTHSDHGVGSIPEALWVEEFLHGRYLKFTKSIVREQRIRQESAANEDHASISAFGGNDSKDQRFPTVNKFFPKQLSNSSVSGASSDDSALGRKNRFRDHDGDRSQERSGDIDSDLDRRSIPIFDWIEAFSHWTYEHTHHELLICELRGIVVKDDNDSQCNQDEDGGTTDEIDDCGQESDDGGQESSECDDVDSCASLPPPHDTRNRRPGRQVIVKLTCPSICSVPQAQSSSSARCKRTSKSRYGPEDGGYGGLRRFRRDHCCNKACILLGLDK